jgi:threonine aldolase
LEATNWLEGTEMKIIDLRSDTVTVPTDEMRRAMYEAEVGDDVYGEDPTINLLEERSAALLGKEAGLFTPSGTMSNLIAVLTHTRAGDEIILGSEAHILWYEVGGASALGGANLRTVLNEADGTMDLARVEAAIRAEDLHFPSTTLLCLENTHNRCGGTVLTAEYTAAASDLGRHHGLAVHLDGARIFNAAVALGVSAAELASPADSVCYCLSKSLSAPVGSVLCGSVEFVDRARKRRKMLGGGMRQAGVIAAAGLVALDTMIDRLVQDHENARRLANGLSQIPGITCSPGQTQTNIVMFGIPSHVPARPFVDRLGEKGVKVNYPSRPRIRAVTHRMIETEDVDRALSIVEDIAKDFPAV